MEKKDFQYPIFWDLINSHGSYDNMTNRMLAYFSGGYLQPMRSEKPHGNYKQMLEIKKLCLNMSSTQDYRNWVREWKIAYKQLVAEQRARKKILSLPHDEENSPGIMAKKQFCSNVLDAMMWLRMQGKQLIKEGTLVADNRPTSTI